MVCPSVFNKKKKTTPLLDNAIITVTHPFLPNSGRQYYLIARRNLQGKERLLCQDIDGSEVLIPIEYTNHKKQDFFREQANGRCDFRYDDLRCLAVLIEEIRKSV